jgi:hypothetical protein
MSSVSSTRVLTCQLTSNCWIRTLWLILYIQDKFDEVPNGIARVKEVYSDMTTHDTLDADDINDDVIDK